MRNLYINIIGLLTILMAISMISAQVNILEADISLSGEEKWDLYLHVNRGRITIDITKTSGKLNFTMFQNNEAKLILPLDSSSSNITQDVSVSEGLVHIIASSLAFFELTDFHIVISQNNSELDGFIAGGLVLFALLTPFVYLFGKSRGQKLA